MARGLTGARVLQDVDVVARAGLDLDIFLEEAIESIGRAVPCVAVCVGTHDPSTFMLTSARKYGHLRTVNSHDHEFGLVEYGTVEATSFVALARAELPAAGVHEITEGKLELSTRLSAFMRPNFGFGDEARVVFRESGRSWGAMALFRGPDDVPFDAAEVEFLASLSPLLARGVRTGMLTRIGEVAPTERDPRPVGGAGPAVVIVDATDQIVQLSPGAEERLRDLDVGAAGADPLSPVSALIGAARRYARGETSLPPRSRVRAASGQWLVLHAGVMSAAQPGRQGDVVITIEEARPPEIVGLVVAAFGLTPRERDVTTLVLQGIDTKEIAATLHLSTYTVQDHLKSIFDKADVRSRRELIARIYFDQYVPRMGGELTPSGWFA